MTTLPNGPHKNSRTYENVGPAMLLAGLPSVKPDRMVLRFLELAIGTDVTLTGDRAIELVKAAANSLDVSPRTLDHVIWRAASGRELTDHTQ